MMYLNNYHFFFLILGLKINSSLYRNPTHLFILLSFIFWLESMTCFCNHLRCLVVAKYETSHVESWQFHYKLPEPLLNFYRTIIVVCHITSVKFSDLLLVPSSTPKIIITGCAISSWRHEYLWIDWKWRCFGARTRCYGWVTKLHSPLFSSLLFSSLLLISSVLPVMSQHSSPLYTCLVSLCGYGHDSVIDEHGVMGEW